MPGIPPGGIGGIAQGNTYPQYGIGGGTPGSAAGWNIVVARNEAQKLSYMQQGYLEWFSSRAAAQAQISSNSSSYGSGSVPGLTGLAAIGDFFSKLGQGNTWIRVAEVVIGLGLIVVGLSKLASGTPLGDAAGKAAKGAMLL